MRKLTMITAAVLLTAASAVPGAAQQSRSGPDPDGRQAQMDPNGPGVPPGDGITARGHDPEGQAYTPPGYNQRMMTSAYPPLAVAPMGRIGGDYPVCSARVTDRCVQAYARYTRTASRGR